MPAQLALNRDCTQDVLLGRWGIISVVSRLIPALVALILAALPFALGQESTDHPTVEISYPRFEFPDKGCDASIQHFRNSPTHFWDGNRVSDSVNLRNGSFERPEAGNYEYVKLSWVQQPNSEDQHIAIVAYRWMWSGGSSSQSDVIQVLECDKGRFIMLQQILNDAHSEQAGATYEARTRILTVRSVRYGAGAHCCPEKLDVVTFKWTGKSFQMIRWETIRMPVPGKLSINPITNSAQLLLAETGSTDLSEDVGTTTGAGAPGEVLDDKEAGFLRPLNLAD